MHLIIKFLLLWLGLVTQGGCDRTRQKIYIDLKDTATCFRRLNATSQIGCNSARGGNVGVVHFVASEADKTWLIESGPHAPYVAVMTPITFNRETVMELAASKKLSGMLVIHTNGSTAPDDFSPDRPCPNDYYSLYNDHPEYAHCKNTAWNPKGNSLFYEDFPFPIMAVKNTTEVYQSLLSTCYETFNKPDSSGAARSFPLCSAEVKVAMDAAKDTPTCIRRSNLQNNLNPQVFCDPLDGRSVYGFLQPINNSRPLGNKTVVWATTRLDSFSMFEDVYPSADAAVSGIVALLAAAHALGKVKDRVSPDAGHRPVMFSFLNGEAFDYIGSQRLLYDMETTAFPWNATGKAYGPARMHPEHFRHVLELSQVALAGDGLFAHSDPVSLKDRDTEALVDELFQAVHAASAEAGLNVVNASHLAPLPPASLQTLLRKVNVSGMVMTDHRAEFANQYYNSRFDTAERIGHVYPAGENASYNYVTDAARHLARVASTVAKSLYTLSTGESDTDDIQANETLVTNLLYCFLESPQCELLNYTMREDFSNIDKEPLSYYVGVNLGNQYRYAYIPVWSLLGYFLSTKTDITDKQTCQDTDDLLYDYVWIRGPVNASSESQEREGRCIKITTNYTRAQSPAFDNDSYDWSSNEYSAWTESRWANNGLGLRIFLVPSRDKEIATLCSGAGALVFSFVLIFLINKRASAVFGDN